MPAKYISNRSERCGFPARGRHMGDVFAGKSIKKKGV
jgi:hypothetical protein